MRGDLVRSGTWFWIESYGFSLFSFSLFLNSIWMPLLLLRWLVVTAALIRRVYSHRCIQRLQSMSWKKQKTNKNKNKNKRETHVLISLIRTGPLDYSAGPDNGVDKSTESQLIANVQLLERFKLRPSSRKLNDGIGRWSMWNGWRNREEINAATEIDETDAIYFDNADGPLADVQWQLLYRTARR